MTTQKYLRVPDALLGSFFLDDRRCPRLRLLGLNWPVRTVHCNMGLRMPIGTLLYGSKNAHR